MIIKLTMKPISQQTRDSDFCLLMVADKWKYKDAANVGIVRTSKGGVTEGDC